MTSLCGYIVNHNECVVNFFGAWTMNRNTVTKLLVDVGTACAKYQDKTLRDLPCKRIQCDEIWVFCYAKQKNIPDELLAS